ncbi:MAG: coproporphyrinogen dehydrogenase [Chloroflexi bacterium HGW-Chloroflexi-1]|nr:MAG: coproporphyrinogen dehydrogenase [Chloroflexi bacterium HGW-Chloroflexi-1]
MTRLRWKNIFPFGGLSERVLSEYLRHTSKQYLKLKPYAAGALPAPLPGRTYTLYAHVPFCERLCPYCSFNRFPFSEYRARPYFKMLREEMRMVAARGYNFRSMYVGGGTPTILVGELAATIDLARELFDIEEVSTETNPNHLVPEVIDQLTDRVQRFSVGVQSFDDDLLRQMNRYDKFGSGDEILERLCAVEGKFRSLNVDMIFNFPSQTEEMLRRDLALAKTTGADQTTFYPLMASPVVRNSLRSTVGQVDYRREADFYRIIADTLTGECMPLSVWTFSRNNGGMIDEYIVDYEDYVGIGSGAFSYLDGSLYVNTFSLRDYQKALAAGRMSVNAAHHFSAPQQMRYCFMMGLFGLRLDKQRFAEDFGVTVERGLFKEMAFMSAAGAFETDDERYLTLTQRGRYLLVAMMREFFVGVNSVRDQARAVLSPEERELLVSVGEPCALEAIRS